MGTVDYMAPEQCDDSHDVDIRADIYSLGATLFKMVTGRAPFATSERRSPLSRIRALATEQPQRLSDVLSGVDLEFSDVVNRMLARNPDDRWPTPGEVAEALAPFTAGHDLKNAVSVAEAAPEPVKKPPLSAPQSLASVQPQESRSAANAGSPPSTGLLTARNLLVVAALAGAIMFRLQTDKGVIVVECDVPNVQIQLLKDGELHDELSLKQGRTSISVFAGQYEIRIPGETDSIEVSAERCTVRRGSKLVAEIRYVKHNETAELSVAPNVAEKMQPTYVGTSMSSWQKQLADRNPGQQIPALKAIGILGVDTNADEAGRMIFETVKHLFRHSSTLSFTPLGFGEPAEEHLRFTAVQAYRPLLDDPDGVELLREFLTDGDTAARRYAICVLDCQEVKPSSSAPGYDAAQRARTRLIPALVAASHDDDIDVRIDAIYQTQGFEIGEPSIVNRYAEMVASDDFPEVRAAAIILFDLAPEKRPMIGQRYIQLYEARKDKFKLANRQGKSRLDMSPDPLALLHVAIECEVESVEVLEDLIAVLTEPSAAPEVRAQAAYLLGLWTKHTDASGRVVATLVNLLESRGRGLFKACWVGVDEFADSKGRSVSYDSLWALFFDELGKFGPAANDAIPFLNEFLSVDLSGNKIRLSLTVDETAKAIDALGRIGMNAESVQTVEAWLGMVNSTDSSGRTIAEVAAEALSRVPAEELKRLRAELSQSNSK